MSAKEPLRPAYLLWGEDRAMVERALARLRSRVEDEGGLPPERFGADETPAETVVGACRALSFAGRRLVIVDDADRWRAADAAPAVEYLAAPNDQTCLALVAREAVTPKLAAAVKALGGSTLLQFGPPAKAGRSERGKWMVDYLRKEVTRAGGRISPKVARAVIDRVLVDSPGARRESTAVLALGQEAIKLAAYADGQPIDLEMVHLLVPRHPDARVYELSDALVAGRAAAAFDLLQDMATGDAPVAPIVIKTQLANHLLRVARVQALGRNPSPEAVGGATGVKGFPARKLVEHAEALPPGAAQTMVARVATLELDLRVSAFADLGTARSAGARDDGARMVLEIAVRDLMATARGESPAPGHGA